MNDTPIAHQREILNEFVYQWEFALKHENSNDVNEVHICLDMNLDFLNGKWRDPTYKLVSLSRIVQNICDIGNFSQMVTEPTRIMYNSVTGTLEKSCLDHIYTNSKYKCSNPTVTPFGASDHDIISYTRYSKVKPTNYPTIRGRSYKYFNISQFLNDLQSIDWTSVLSCLELDEALGIFNTILNNIYDRHAPWKVYQKRKNYAPWITEELKYLMSERDKWKGIIKNINSNSESNSLSQDKENAINKFK